MNTENLLRAVRPVFALIRRPGTDSSLEPKFWSMRLDGLDQNAIKVSADALRERMKRRGRNPSTDETLKLSSLRHGLAKALGVKTIDAWQQGEDALCDFLVANGMTEPRDLINWSRAPSGLTARQISDRIFNSGLPIPEKIFTGIGSKLFIAKGRGRNDINELSGLTTYGDEARFKWCEARADQVVLSLKRESDGGPEASDIVQLTGRDLLLHAFRFDHLHWAFNLLGDNLVSPMLRPAELRRYDSDTELSKRVFDIFRQEIERSESGWVEVIPFPGNDNLVFLKGNNGAFDWVIRNQRDEAFTGNPYHPILKNKELPTAMKAS